MKELKYFTLNEILPKIGRFCAYQERTQEEVRQKLYSFGLSSSLVEETLTKLILDNFINEERYAKAFALGKFRQTKWGKIKIKNQLKFKGLTDYLIKKGISEINDEEYNDTLEKLVINKIKSLTGKNTYEIKNKAALYVISKGYESDLVWDIVNKTPF